MAPSDRTRGSEHKLKYRKLHLNIRKSSFTVRVTDYWHRLPREVMGSPFMEILKTQLHAVMSSLLQVTLLWARGWTRQSLDVPSNLGNSVSLSLTFHTPFPFRVSEVMQKSAGLWLPLILQSLPGTSWMSGHPSFLPERRLPALRSPESRNCLFRKALTNLLGCEQALESLKSGET